jgi:hypothetical protein
MSLPAQSSTEDHHMETARKEDETPHSPGDPNLPSVHYPNQKFGFQLQETVVVMVQIV